MSLRKVSWRSEAFEELYYWLRTNRHIALRIVELVDEARQNPFEGQGRPKRLEREFSGLWSRRITRVHRLVYEVLDDEICVYQCRYHYKK
jgi:toxin YoeB